MFFGLTWDKILIIVVLAALIIGPDRLPRYAEGLAKLFNKLRSLLSGAKDRIKEDMGSDFENVDWQKLDPRQYDPRRIVRDALFEDAAPAKTNTAARNRADTAAAVAQAQNEAVVDVRIPGARPDGNVPFDDEAT